MQIKPTGTRVLIQIEKIEQTESGIILPEESKKALEKAKILAIGPDVTSVKEGDEVYFKLYATDTIEVEGKEYAFLSEGEILATT